MKKLCTLSLLLLWSFSSFSQSLRDSVHLKTNLFTIVYSEVLEQPKAVWYTVKCTGPGASRSGVDFYTVPGVKTSDNADYVNNEWDKGHMAPAASFNCTPEMLKATFAFTNCALQQENLNRGAWRLLELEERKIAAQTPVRVYIRLDFEKNPNQSPADFRKNPNRLPTGATIPTGFYKEIVYGNMTECYYFPNKKPATTDYTAFKCKCR